MIAIVLLVAAQGGERLPSQGLAVSPNGRWLATSHDSDRMTVFDLASGKQRSLVYKPKADSIYPMLRGPVFSRDSSMLTSGTASPDDGASPLWSTKTWKLLREIAVWRSSQSADGLVSVQFSRSGKLIYGMTNLFLNQEDTQHVVAIDTTSGLIRYSDHLLCSAMVSDPISEGLLVVNGNGYRTYDPTKDQAISWGFPSRDSFQGIIVSGDGQKVVVWTSTQDATTMRIYPRTPQPAPGEEPDVKPIAEIQVSGLAARAVCWVPGRAAILLAGLHGRAQIVDLQSTQVIARFTAPDKQHLRGCAVLPDGRRAFVGGDSGVIHELHAKDLSTRRSLSVSGPRRMF